MKKVIVIKKLGSMLALLFAVNFVFLEVIYAEMSIAKAYEILDLNPGANSDDIERAYRQAARKFHPDKHISRGKDAAAEAEASFKLAGEAYDTLKEYFSRARASQKPAASSKPESDPFMNWAANEQSGKASTDDDFVRVWDETPRYNTKTDDNVEDPQQPNETASPQRTLYKPARTVWARWQMEDDAERIREILDSRVAAGGLLRNRITGNSSEYIVVWVSSYPEKSVIDLIDMLDAALFNHGPWPWTSSQNGYNYSNGPKLLPYKLFEIAMQSIYTGHPSTVEAVLKYAFYFLEYFNSKYHGRDYLRIRKQLLDKLKDPETFALLRDKAGVPQEDIPSLINRVRNYANLLYTSEGIILPWGEILYEPGNALGAGSRFFLEAEPRKSCSSYLN